MGHQEHKVSSGPTWLSMAPVNSALFGHRGAHSGWLYKEKGDHALAKWFNPVGRRYFTINFDHQILVYSHSEQFKQVGQPIAFREIICATASFDERDGDATLRRNSLAPTGSWPFELVTTSRRIRLAAEVERDALRWISMLNSAAAQGRGLQSKPPTLRSREDDSGCESKGPSSAMSDKASQQSTTPGATTPKSVGSRASTPKSDGENLREKSWNDVVSKIEELERSAATSYKALAISGRAAAALAASSESRNPETFRPNPVPVPEEAEGPQIEVEEDATRSPGQRMEEPEETSSPGQQTEAFCSPTKRLQASDFGFDEDDEDGATTDAEQDPLPVATPSACQPEAHDSSDEERPVKSQVARVAADLMLLQKSGASVAETSRIAADLALLEKMRRAAPGATPCRRHQKAKEHRCTVGEQQA